MTRLMTACITSTLLFVAGGAAFANPVSLDPIGLHDGNLISNNAGFNATPCTDGWDVEITNTETACRIAEGMAWINHNNSTTDPALAQRVTGLKVGQRYELNVGYSAGTSAKTYVNDPSAAYFGVEVVGSDQPMLEVVPGLEVDWQVATLEFTALMPDVVVRLVGELGNYDGDVLVDWVKLEELEPQALLEPGGTLEQNQRYTSADGAYYLIWETSGNGTVSIYETSTNQITWQISSRYEAITEVALTQSGRLEIRGVSGLIWAASGSSTMEMMTSNESSESFLFISSTGTLSFYSRTEGYAEEVSEKTSTIWETADMGACGEKPGGGGGFGKRRTNSHGDVHIFTPDGLTYDFQAAGEFLLLESMDHSVVVHARQEKHKGNPGVSSNSAVALNVAGDVIEFYTKPKLKLFINGEAVAYDTSSSAEMFFESGAYMAFDSAGRRKGEVTITWPGEAFIARINIYSGFLNIGVEANPNASMVFRGLLGNLDGNPANDMLVSGGSLICGRASSAQLNEFGDSWRLSKQQTLLKSDFSEVMSVERSMDDIRREAVSFYSAGQGSTSATSMATTSTATTSSTSSTTQTTTQTTTTFASATVEVSATLRRAEGAATIETVSAGVRAKAQQACEAAGITNPLALFNCISDFALTSNGAFIESASSFEQTIEDVVMDNVQVAVSETSMLTEAAFYSQDKLTTIIAESTKFMGIQEGGYFRLTTMFRQNENECLEGNQVNGSAKEGAAFMDRCQNVSGQLWRAIPLDNGYFRLTTMFREGANECLESNEVNGSAMNGASFMDSCQDVTGQYWTAIPQDNGYYRLTTLFRNGKGECLEGNQINGSAKEGAAFMDTCQNVSGQLWTAIAVQ